MKYIKYFILVIFLFLLMPCVYAAENVSIESIDIDSKSNTTEILTDASHEGLSVKFDLKFNQLNDYIKYKVIIDNPTDEDYEIVASSNFDDSEYITYEFSYLDDSKVAKKNSKTTMYITIKYAKEVPFESFTNGSYDETNNFVINLGNDIIDVPDTLIYGGFFFVVLLSLGISLLIIKETRNKNYISIFIITLLLLPITMYAKEKLQIKVESKVKIDRINMIEARYENSDPYNGNRDFWEYSEYIEKITFMDKIEEPSEYAYKYDVSNDKDETVWAYLVENSSNNYDLYIMANGNIYANPDSTYVFGDMYILNEIKGLEYYKTVTATDMSAMFSYVYNIDNLDLTTFNTSNVLYMNEMFATNYYEAHGFKSIKFDNWDTSNVIDMSHMFKGQVYLADMDLSKWDTSNVVNMSSMFYLLGHNVEISLDLNDWDTSSVTDMSNMFYDVGFSATTVSLDISDWDTSNVTNMSGMFYNLGGNASTFNLDLSGWDTSSVNNMSSMFSYAGYHASEWTITIPNNNGNGIDNTTDKLYGSNTSTYAEPISGKSFTLAG